MELQAHRGANNHYPENTFASYIGAMREGYTINELDTKFTKDNVCVLLHDKTINRTARYPDGREIERPIKPDELTLTEIREFDFGIWFDKAFRGTKIPTLGELLIFIASTKFPVKFDNCIQNSTEEQQEIFFDQIEKSEAEDYIAITAKTVDFAAKIGRRLKKCTICYDGPTSPAIYEDLKTAANGHPLYIWLPSEKKSWLPYPPATAEDVALAKRYGKVGLWTAHDKETLDDILALKPDGMELDGEITPDVVKARIREQSSFCNE